MALIIFKYTGIAGLLIVVRTTAVLSDYNHLFRLYTPAYNRGLMTKWRYGSE